MKKTTLGVLVGMCISSTGMAAMSEFVGSWVNTNANTRGITKIRVFKNGGNLKLSAKGSCHPTDCNWGQTEAIGFAGTVSEPLATKANSVTAVFEKNHAETLLVLKPRRGQLIVESFTSFTDGSNRTDYHNTYVFKRARSIKILPDLIVASLGRPRWDASRSKTVFSAVIKNIGRVKAGRSIARLMDPSTKQSSGAPYNATANVRALNPGQSQTVIFELPYWIYNPDASYNVKADYKNMVLERNENNNKKDFYGIG